MVDRRIVVTRGICSRDVPAEPNLPGFGRFESAFSWLIRLLLPKTSLTRLLRIDFRLLQAPPEGAHVTKGATVVAPVEERSTAKSGQRKCLCCGHFFDVDHRIGERQRYCYELDCRRASKAASQAAWLAKPQNQDYFRDPVHVARVQAWRAAHHGYNRAKRREPPALQDSMMAQAHDCVEESSNRGEIAGAAQALALQNLLNAPSPVLAGLIAHLFDVALQDEMALAWCYRWPLHALASRKRVRL